MRLVFLHALPLDGTMWTDDLRAVADSVAPTLYGLGESLESWAQGVLDVVGSGPLVVVGSSVGGSCALEVARLAPDRVAAVVLIGAKASVRPEPEARDEAVGILKTAGMAEAWPRYWAPLFSAHAPPAVVERARRIAFAQSSADVVRGVVAFHDRGDRSDFARSWQKPLVAISGDLDRTPPATTMAALAASVPNGQLHVIQGAGHYVSLEQPRRVGTILRRVIEQIA